MQIPRFFLTKGGLDLKPGATISIDDLTLVNQIRQVLRMSEGDRLTLLDNSGQQYASRIESLSPKHVNCLITESSPVSGEPSIKIQLALALLKGEKFDWALQKATELGARSIVPIISERTVVKIAELDAKRVATKVARWQAILRESAEQCERGTIPHIVSPRKIEDFINDATAGGTDSTLFICVERLQVTPLKDILSKCDSKKNQFFLDKNKTISVLIGPEGGFTDSEIEYARNKGAIPVSLGTRILRAETAAMYAVAQIMWCLEK